MSETEDRQDGQEVHQDAGCLKLITLTVAEPVGGRGVKIYCLHLAR